MKLTLKTQKFSRKPKYKTHNPITIAVPKAQMVAIKAVPRKSLEQFRLNKGTATDWYNIMFRVHSAYEISLLQYEKSTQEELHLILMTMLVIKDKVVNNNWLMTEGEILDVEQGLDAMDVMEDACTRRVLLDVMHKTQNYLKQFIKS